MTDKVNLDNYSQEQVNYMVQELCILVNEKDEVKGGESKKFCHLWENISKDIALHRAFSIFLFDLEGNLLLQQRASEKITFPDHWTNTVCSHPLYNLPEELNGMDGVKLAAQRKLTHELGIPASEVPLEKFHCLTRILYKAPSDGIWGEHEVDYILFAQVDKVSINPNPSEVRDFKYVTAEQLEKMFDEASKGTIRLTPWFRMICNKFLFNWWTQLRQKTIFSTPYDDKIHLLE